MNVRPVSAALQKKAEKELNEVPSRIEKDIQHLREWLIQQPHLHAKTDDQWLLNVLRGSKFSLQRAKDKLDTYYTMRNLLPEFFRDRNPFLPDIQEVLKLGIVLPLPKTVGDDGPRIMLVRWGDFDTKIPYTVAGKAALMIVDILFNEDDNFIIAGQHALCDATGASLEYALTVNLNVVKKLEVCLEKGYPTRPQAFDLVNAPAFVEGMYAVSKSLLSEKIRERVHIYSGKNTDKIYEIIPCSHLPKDYGGEGDSIADLTAYWKKKVESYKDWFLEDEKYYSDETKRQGKPKITDQMLGIEGSFRKLEFD